MHLKEGKKTIFTLLVFLTKLVFIDDLSSLEPTEQVGVGSQRTVQTVRLVSSPSVCAIWGLEESRLQCLIISTKWLAAQGEPWWVGVGLPGSREEGRGSLETI